MHFTYVAPDADQLKQGDVLEKTEEIQSLLDEVHPHYADDKYKYFQVLTQTCDLVLGRRGRECKSRYITLAAVRDLDVALKRQIVDKAQRRTDVGGQTWSSDEHKHELFNFLRRLLNNNETEYFFLHEEPAYEIYGHHCTFLQLTIAIKSYFHYPTCLAAKRLELEPTFQAKLGWQVGNLYSRVGTEDYTPGKGIRPDDFEKEIQEIIDSHIFWVPKAKFSTLERLAERYEDSNRLLEEVEKKIEQKRNSRIETLIGAVGRAVDLTRDQKKALRNELSQDASVQRFLDQP